MPKYLPGEPSGSAADVRGKGRWTNGRWTVELSRKLNTGYADDTTFDTARTYKMGVAIFDRSEDIDHLVSDMIELVFNSAIR